MVKIEKIKRVFVGGLTASGSAIGFYGVFFGAIDLITYSEMMKAEMLAGALIFSAFGIAKLIK